MKVYESVEQFLEVINAKRLASVINLSKSQIYRYANDPENGGTRLPADMIPMITKISGNYIILQNLCQLSDAVCIPLANNKIDHNFLKVVQKRIIATKTIIDANVDCKITKSELKKIKKSLYESITASAEYISFLEKNIEKEEDK